MLSLLLVVSLSSVVVPTTQPGANVCTPLSVTGQHYVRATATDGDGNESGLSNEVLKTLPDDVCWDNPTENVDGSPLVDLVSVTVYYDVDPIDPAPVPEPLPPVMLAGEETVYVLQATQLGSQPGRLVLLPVGTVPAGTSCDPNMGANVGTGFHGQVPNDAVAWTSPTGARPVVVVAQCNG